MRPTNNWISRAVILAIVGGLLLGLSSVFAQQSAVFDMLQKYGQTSSPGDFEGTLYCIRCSFSPTPANLATCNLEGHAHFLVMDDGHLHPLYGINKAIANKINSKELHEKKVTVRGKYYPVLNAILVADVQPAAK